MSPSELGCSTIYVHYHKNQGAWQTHVCHVAVCMWHPIPLDALQAKKGSNPPKPRNCPSHFSECPSLMVPIPFAVAGAPPFQPELPISRSQHFKCHRSAVQGFSLYQMDALQAKNGNKPPKASNLSLTVLRVPVPNGPDLFCSDCGAPLGYT